MPDFDDARSGRILPEEDITGGGMSMPYVASPWLWGELDKVDASRCSIVEYEPNETCCFPIRSLRPLSQEELGRVVRHGKTIGSIERAEQVLGSFGAARRELLTACNGLVGDNEIKVPDVVPLGMEWQFINLVIHRSGTYVSAARRLIDQIEISAKTLNRSGLFSYESIKDSLNEYGRLKNIPLGIVVPLRDALEHTPEFVNVINYRPDSRTFGLAVNLESGLGDQIMKDRHGKKANKNITPILNDIRKLISRYRSEGKTPLISFADLQIWTDMYASIYLMKLAEVANDLYRDRSLWEFVISKEGDPTMQKGVLWTIDHPENRHETYLSNRLYEIKQSNLLTVCANNIQAFAEMVFWHSMSRCTERTDGLGKRQPLEQDETAPTP